MRDVREDPDALDGIQKILGLIDAPGRYSGEDEKKKKQREIFLDKIFLVG